MFSRIAFAAAIALSGSAAVAGPTVTPNASGGAITVVTPVPVGQATAASEAAPILLPPTAAQQQAPAQPAPAPAPAQSSFISNYIASFR